MRDGCGPAHPGAELPAGRRRRRHPAAPTHTDEGMQAALHIRRHHPGVAVLVLSQYVELGLATTLLTESPEGPATC